MVNRGRSRTIWPGVEENLASPGARPAGLASTGRNPALDEAR